MPAPVLLLIGDANREDDTLKTFFAVEAEFGRLDALIYNADISGPMAHLEATDRA